MNKMLKILRVMQAFFLLTISFFSTQPARALEINIGLVTDANGIADKSYNYMAYQGLLQAETDLGITPTLYESGGDYATYLEQCVTDGNVLCFGVGWPMGDAVIAAANANPTVKFAILDNAADSPPDNLRQIIFNEKQAGYLAGALAGKMTTSNIIGDIGGMDVVPAVVSFVEGYRNGAQCANPNVSVKIVYTNSFNNPVLGAETAKDMIAQGADVIFAAAGGTGSGAIEYSTQHDVWGIGVDSDQYVSLFNSGAVDGADKLLSSAMKRLDNAVYDTIEDYKTGNFTSGTLTYDLATQGVGLAPYHETDASIPTTTKNYINNIKNRIIAGTLNINQTCRLTVNSTAAQDGWVLESTETSNAGGTLHATAATLLLGDNNLKRQYRSILSFNTSSLPDDAVINKLMLKVKMQSIVGGGNPVTTFQGIKVEIKNGFLGTTALQTSDFQATTDKTCGPFSPALVNNWYSINLISGKDFINKASTNGGLTQFRLRFTLDDNNNAITNTLNLYSGNAPAGSRPQLLISYYVP